MDGDVQEIFLLRKSMHLPLASECRIFQCLSLPGVWDLEGWNRSACTFGPWFWFYSKNRHLRHASSNVFNWYTCTKRQKTTILQLDVGSLGQAAKVLEHFLRKLAPRWTWAILDVKGWISRQQLTLHTLQPLPSSPGNQPEQSAFDKLELVFGQPGSGCPPPPPPPSPTPAQPRRRGGWRELLRWLDGEHWTQGDLLLDHNGFDVQASRAWTGPF